MNSLSKVSVGFAARLYLLAVALVTIGYGLLNVRIRSEFALGDWLINYSGGFVRRGLAGEGVLLLSALHLPPLVLVLAMELAAYGVMWLFLWTLAPDFRWSLWSLALWVSPATLAFPVLNPPGGYRKEILLFALLCGVLAALRARVKPGTVSALLAAGVVVMLLSHEALLLFVPYLLAPLLLTAPRLRPALRLLVLPLLATVVMVVILRHPGTPQQREVICNSVIAETHGVDAGLCGGAIGAIGVTQAAEHQMVLRTTRRFDAVPLYSALALLALLPLLLTLEERTRAGRGGRAARVIAGCVAVSSCLSAPLFYSAIDWGRWIAIHIMCALLLLLFAYTPERGSAAESVTLGEILPTGWARPAAIAGLAAYAMLWTLPFYGGFPARAGYVGLVRYFRAHRAKHTSVPAATVVRFLR